jgi:alpha-galactosidase
MKFALALALLCVFGAQSAEVQKILFLGNSITLHGPNKNIGWDGNWGMAASSEDKDYVHEVTKALTPKDGAAPKILVRNIATFERQFATFDAAALVKETSAFNADLIVVAIGENAPSLTNATSKALFAEKTAALLKAIAGDRKPLVIVRSCFWANAPKDDALKTACKEIGGVYLDIGALGKDEKNFARSERAFTHAGVANHPGDKGMQAIADAIVGAVRQAKGSTP